MGIVGVSVFGLELSEFVIIVGFAGAAAAWVVSLARDWRPMRALREENRGLREDLDAATQRIRDLEGEIGQLKKATDLTVLQREHRDIIAVIERLVDRIERLDGSVRGNTAAVELIAKKDVIDRAIEEAK